MGEGARFDMFLNRLVLSAVLSTAAMLAADPTLLSYVPADAKVIGGVDVERARDSFLGRMLLDKMKDQDKAFSEMAAATGFDPRRDLREVIFASSDADLPGSSAGAKSAKDTSGLVVMKGVYDPSRLRGMLHVSGMTAESINGIEMFTKANENAGMAMIDSSVALAGDKASVRAALQRRGTASSLPPDVLARIQELSGANDMWIYTSLPVAQLAGTAAKASPGGDPTGGMMNGDAFKGIQQTAFALRFNANAVDLTADLLLNSEKDARALSDVARFLASLMSMNRQKPEMAGLANALDTLKLTTADRSFKMTLSVPSTEIEKMLKQTEKKAPVKKI